MLCSCLVKYLKVDSQVDFTNGMKTCYVCCFHFAHSKLSCFQTTTVLPLCPSVYNDAHLVWGAVLFVSIDESSLFNYLIVAVKKRFLD